MTDTQTKLASGLERLKRATHRATMAQTKADAELAKRDDLATDLADRGARYSDLAAAMGITTDGVTYVLRKVRRART